ncbi:GAF domain-containing protein [Shigella flexneri]
MTSIGTGFGGDRHAAPGAGCDASALLRYDARRFIPLAIDGLAKDVLGSALRWKGTHVWRPSPRRRRRRFPADAIYRSLEGLIPGQESLKVPASIGLPLFPGQNLIGALTLDGMSPDEFDVFSDEELRLIAALAAGALVMRY